MPTPDVIPGRQLHRCDLGGGSWAAETYGAGALSRCERCGRWSYLVYGDWGWEWRRVYWYHWRLRRRIRRSNAGGHR